MHPQKDALHTSKNHWPWAGMLPCNLAGSNTRAFPVPKGGDGPGRAIDRQRPLCEIPCKLRCLRNPAATLEARGKQAKGFIDKLRAALEVAPVRTN